MAAMIEMDDERMQRALQEALDMTEPPLEHDLWPRMRAKLEAPPPTPSWLDWTLLAAIAAAALLFPQIMLGVLYHL
jgi:hypothetical protein